MIVDTDILIDVMQGADRAIQTVGALESQQVPLRVSAVSQFELYHSIERVTDASTRRRQIENVLETKTVYPADSAVMKKAGRIDGRLAADGRAIGIGDTIIGATALIHEEPVLTRNVDHFERIDGLDIESY
ncbi:nucleic acid-binding protein [Natrialba chahannaoensis JCM 10990]|uniref:Ribonuclease VapC n=1 Tax=Natrialba chahannaoensis JCM 10990 TaxID=1227492 RepID=M0A970_9EURY|nr:type II toxin-antitoxin system VapC family toxin [Natrialba chahannaoensis]ELY95325.1 nucleic acid-binding protein [Natrialba chahannaoensis JCM 10990]